MSHMAELLLISVNVIITTLCLKNDTDLAHKTSILQAAQQFVTSKNLGEGSMNCTTHLLWGSRFCKFFVKRVNPVVNISCTQVC